MPTNPGKNFWRWKNYLEVGKKFMDSYWEEVKLCQKLLESPPEKDKIKVRVLKRIAQIFTDKIFPRDPKIVAKAKRPMPGPIPTDPATGMPAVDPMTGSFMPPQDLSKKRAEVVELVLQEEFREIGLAQELRAAIHDAFIYPASFIQSGFFFDEQREADSAYSRRRSMLDIILDPNIESYFGQVHNCRFIGIRLRMTREDCIKRGIDPEKIPEHDQETEGPDQLFQSPDQQKESYESGEEDYTKGCVRYRVWQIWDIWSRTFVYLSENADEMISPEKPWPWKIKAFPIKILAMDRLPDKPFGHSVVWDLQDQQVEINDLRTTMHDQVIDAKPFTVYDKGLLSEDQISNIANRRKDLHVGIDGLAGKMIEQFFRKINPDGMTAEQLQFYNFLKEEIFDIGGTSANDRFQAENTTATEAAIIDKASTLMAGAKSASVTIFARDVIRDLHAIVEQTYTTERITGITSPEMGELWVTWSGPEFLRDFNINLDLTTSEPNDPDYERGKAEKLLTLLSQFPGANIGNLIIDLLEAYGKRKAERYYAPPMPMSALLSAGGKPGEPGGKK